MKSTVVALSLLTSIAAAAPQAGADLKGGYGKYSSYGSYNGAPADYKPPMDDAPKCPAGPIPYTSTYHVKAVPEEVVGSDNQLTGGKKGAVGYYDFGINSDLNLICYYIRLENFGNVDYQSAAKTSTHIHEAVKGKAGPPRLAFPNPQPLGDHRTSVGCLQGPFTTGIMADGKDTGAGFHVSQIEANPSGFFADVHTTDAVPGAVRGQLS